MLKKSPLEINKNWLSYQLPAFISPGAILRYIIDKEKNCSYGVVKNIKFGNRSNVFKIFGITFFTENGTEITMNENGYKRLDIWSPGKKNLKLLQAQKLICEQIENHDFPDAVKNMARESRENVECAIDVYDIVMDDPFDQNHDSSYNT